MHGHRAIGSGRQGCGDPALGLRAVPLSVHG
jgi:hypothetical protein